jgi:hypothetical protein
VVPYTISDAPFPNRVTDAIDLIEDQTPGVRFVLRTSESNYVTFQNSTGCSSEIGMIGGQQFINLASGCSTGNAAHEILHALGMYHEHTRCDRDGFVTIDYDEVEDGKKHNFHKAGSGSEGGACSGAFDIGAYDFGSMMHYPFDAFAIGSNPTIIPIVTVPAGVTVGQRSQVGDTDVETVDQRYGANNAAPSAVIARLAPSYSEGTPVPFNASASTDADDDDAQVTVNNVAPTVDAGPDATVDSGETFDFSGTFSDPGIVDNPWGWVIQWGFGPNTAGSTNDQSAAIEASRQVCVAGQCTVRLTVTDKDGGVGFDELTLTVPYIPVGIDILPGTDLNPVNIGSRGTVPVVVLGSVDLDVADIDPATLTLGDEAGSDTPVTQKNNGTYSAYLEDVNGDGFMDLTADFAIARLVGNGDLTALSTEIVLRGFLSDGCTNFRGSDVVSPIIG